MLDEKQLTLYTKVENVKMIILLLIMAWKMSEASAGDDYLQDLRSPRADIVRQLEYAQRMAEDQPEDSHAIAAGTVSGRKHSMRRVNVSNDFSTERIDTLRSYVTGRMFELCDFSCHECYRCTLLYGDTQTDWTDELDMDE